MLANELLARNQQVTPIQKSIKLDRNLDLVKTQPEGKSVGGNICFFFTLFIKSKSFSP